jgi:hypothetical protein
MALLFTRALAGRQHFADITRSLRRESIPALRLSPLPREGERGGGEGASFVGRQYFADTGAVGKEAMIRIADMQERHRAD